MPNYNDPLDPNHDVLKDIQRRKKEFTGPKGFRELQAELEMEPDEYFSQEGIETPQDYQDQVRAWITRIMIASNKYLEAKYLITPPIKIPRARQKVLKDFLYFGKIPGQKWVWEKPEESFDLGLSVADKLRNSDRGYLQVKQEMEEANQMLAQVGQEYMQQLAEALPVLQGKLETEQARYQTSVGREEEAGGPVANLGITPELSDMLADADDDTRNAIMQAMQSQAQEKPRTIDKRGDRVGRIVDSIRRVENAIRTVQGILAGEEQFVQPRRFSADPQNPMDTDSAKFFALGSIISNRELMRLKLGTVKSGKEPSTPRGEVASRPENLDTLTPENPDIPKENVDRFFEILESIGPGAAINYAEVALRDIKKVYNNLDSGVMRLRNFSGDESFLNGKTAKIVEINEGDERPLVVMVNDDELASSDRLIKISLNEGYIIDGRIRNSSPSRIARSI